MNAEGGGFSIVLASRNRKKSSEITKLLSPHGINVLSIADFPNVPETEEDGETFAENAAKKASETAKFLSQWAIGEDSGLMVDALQGAPGIYSARFSGENATDDENNRKLLAELQNVPEEKRQAQYVCNVAVADASGNIRLQTEARCRGRISTAAFGTNGFGYDPYFLITEYHRTFGELSPAVKSHLSHRARAFGRLIPKLVQILKENSGSSNFRISSE